VNDALAESSEVAVSAIEASIKLLAEHRAIKGVNRNYKWIPQVSLAAAYRLKSMLASGDAAAEAFDQALAQYSEAIEGREGSPFLKPYVRVVSHLQAAADKGVFGRAPASTRPTPATAPATKSSTQPAERSPAGASPAAKPGSVGARPEAKPKQDTPQPPNARKPARRARDR
jgi:hypothetical protein